MHLSSDKVLEAHNHVVFSTIDLLGYAKPLTKDNWIELQFILINAGCSLQLVIDSLED